MHHLKRIPSLLCLVGGFLLLLAFPEDAWASHAVGADLAYTCIGGNEYGITLNLYRDCAGVQAPTSAVVSVSSASCGVSLSRTLFLQSSTEVSPLCPNQINSSTCHGGALPGIQQYIYSGNVTLPFQCNDWIISYDLCCRNMAITNLVNPGNYYLHTQATLNNTGGLCDNSPLFTTLPVPYICAGQQFNYNHGAVDVDGDSLVYSLINPMTYNGAPIPFVPGMSVNDPLNTLGAFVFDPTTGQMSFTPQGMQQGVTAVLVQEYRGGVLIGSTVRDMQIISMNCNNNLPTATGINGTNVFIDSINIGFSYCFTIQTTDPDNGQQLALTWNNGINGATFTAAGSPYPTGTFCWTPSVNDIGVNVFSVTVADNACPVFGSNTYTFLIYVRNDNNPHVNAGPDKIICQNQSVQLSAFGVPGALSYSWSPAAGLSNPNIANPIASPTTTTIYTVTAVDSNGNLSSDNITVYVTSPQVVTVYPSNVSTCPGGQVILSASSPTGTSYSWSTGETTSSITITPLVSGIYTVTAYNAGGCPSLPDTVNVIVDPPQDTIICSNIYVTPHGAGDGSSPLSPTTLSDALNTSPCTNTVIKMSIGTYYIDAPITYIPKFTTLEGGFDTTNNWMKTSLAGATTIFRNDGNYEGPANALRLTAIDLTGATDFRFQDLTIRTANATGTAVTTYGMHLSGCSDYDIVRVQVLPGNGSKGADGAPGINGQRGGDGGDGGDASPNNSGNPGHGGSGGAGGGTGGGTPGTGGFDTNGAACCMAGPNGTNGSSSTNTRAGGAGGGGGCGGEAGFSGGTGGNAGRINNQTLLCCGGVGGAGGNPGQDGVRGDDGVDGIDGTNGALGSFGTHVTGYYVPGGQGGTGTDGTGGGGGAGSGGGGGQTCLSPCIEGAGGGGGGGSGGGEGATGGTGGYGGGGSFAIYLYQNGANTAFDDCYALAGAAGPGGTGGLGGIGGDHGDRGNGGQGGLLEVGEGAEGGEGGRGGHGGNGGNGRPGTTQAIYQSSGTAPLITDISFNLSVQPEIKVENLSCTSTDINLQSQAANNWTFGAGSNPANATGSLVTTQWSTVGRKNITYGASTYTGFVYIAINAATYLPDINTSAQSFGTDIYRVCLHDLANFFTNTTAIGYQWDFGGAVSPNNYSAASLTNLQFNSPGVFTISLQVETGCCGWSLPKEVTLYVDTIPQIIVSGDTSICAGENTTLSLSGASNYLWIPSTGLNPSAGATVVANPMDSTTYSITASNLNGTCSTQTTIHLNVNDNPSVVVNTTNASCAVGGSATAVPQVFPNNYQYQWSTNPVQTSISISNLAPGNYTVSVTDASTGCQSTVTANVANTNRPIPYIVASENVNCHGGNNGNATINTVGGTPGYNYNWSNGASGTVISNLTAAIYKATVTDAAGCTATTDVTIQQPDILTLAVDTIVSANCSAASAKVVADGGAGSFTYEWSTNPVQTTDSATNLTAGTYQVTATDANGCTVSTAVAIAASGSCDDGNNCTIDDCITGNCVHTLVNCDDANPCTVDLCINAICRHTNATVSNDSLIVQWWKENCCCR